MRDRLESLIQEGLEGNGARALEDITRLLATLHWKAECGPVLSRAAPPRLRGTAAAAEVFLNLATLLVHAGSFAEAVENFGKALRIRPRHALAYNGRAHALTQLQDHAGALSDYARAVQIEPTESLFHLNKALCHHVLGERQDAAVHLRVALELGDEQALALVRRLSQQNARSEPVAPLPPAACHVAPACTKSSGVVH